MGIHFGLEVRREGYGIADADCGGCTGEKPSCQDFTDDIAVDVREAEVPALGAEGELGVVEA